MQTHTNKQLRCDVSMTPPVVSELIGKWLPYTSRLSGTVGLPQPVRSSESRNAMDSGPAASGEVSAFFFCGTGTHMDSLKRQSFVGSTGKI